jgi:hypothetical protein
MVSNQETLASRLQCTARLVRSVIAIMPKLGAGGASAMPSSSRIPLANKAEDRSFGTVLEQTESSPAESLGAARRPSQLFVREANSSVSGSKRDAKLSDPTSNRKPSDSPDPGTSMDKISAPLSDDRDTKHQSAPQPPFSPVFAGNAGISSFAPDGLGTSLAVNGTPPRGRVLSDATLTEKVALPPTSGADSTRHPNALPSTLPALPPEPVLSKPQPETNDQDSSNPANADPLTSAAGISTDSEAQPGMGSAIGAAGGASVGNDPTHADGNKTQAAGNSEIEQGAAPLDVALPALVMPATGPKKMESGKSLTVIPSAPVAAATGPEKMDPGKPLGVEVQPIIDKSRGIVMLDASGPTRKTAEVTGGAKSQPHKEDSASPDSSQASDPATIIPAKAIETVSFLSVAGNQSLMTPAEVANTIGPVSHDAVDRQPGQPDQPDQKSAIAAESQAPAEIASAYPPSLVHSAKLVERIGEAELRLGIRAGEFGSVDIRTSMVRNQFTAEIAVERGELGRAMTAELHGLQSRLIERGIPEVVVTVQNHVGGQSTASEQHKPRDGRQMYSTKGENGQPDGSMTPLVASEATTASSRLDIHM